LEKDALMFYTLSKTAALLLFPSNLLIILGLLGVTLIALGRKRVGTWMAALSIVVLAAAGYVPIGNFFIHLLEERFPPWDVSHGAPDGIVVLGGAISPRLSRAHGETVIDGDAGRIIALAKLARAYPAARIVYSGGDASLFADESPEADYIYPLLDSFGIARERVLLEKRSRNTFENAAFTKQLVNPKPGERWLLVTSALHMPRAIGCFRKVGFQVEAYPVGWRTAGKLDANSDRTLSDGIKRLDAAAYEWIGLAAYWVSGKTAELLPSP
jgi:uncharacterized SAM-binding protein YcdF (DUF218 family)